MSVLISGLTGEVFFRVDEVFQVGRGGERFWSPLGIVAGKTSRKVDPLGSLSHELGT